MMIAPFEASRLKLERAMRHGQELKWLTDNYLAEKPCVIVVETFPGGNVPQMRGTQAWVARIRKPVPLHLSATIGDLVHNLRAALDLLACDLVRLAGQSTKGVHFPFCDIPEDLPDMIKRRNLHRAGADVVQVVKSLKPYKGGDVALRAIHDMDIADKHQALLPVLGAVSIPLGQILPGLPSNPQTDNFSTLVAKDGQMIIGLPAYEHTPPLGAELPARFYLAFHGIPGLGGGARCSKLCMTSPRRRMASSTRAYGAPPWCPFPSPAP